MKYLAINLHQGRYQVNNGTFKHDCNTPYEMEFFIVGFLSLINPTNRENKFRLGQKCLKPRESVSKTWH